MRRNKRILKRKEQGITLIALVITIIVLLILAGVSIAMLTGENGILSQAQRAKSETENAQAEEENILSNYESVLNSYSGENTEFIDDLGNKVVVPAGFKVVNPEDNVEDGIVIEDVTHVATAGSQFVWIPVGENIKKSDGTTFDIILGRYVFNEDGFINTELSQKEPDGQLRQNLTTSYYCTEGLKNSETNNTHSKDIVSFISSVNDNGGYYIGRYEARTEIERSSREDLLTQITVKPNDYVYNYVTQAQAAKESQKMYNDNNFTSDLINSYAWDTAIVFLQECDDRNDNTIPYSMQTKITSDFGPKGTNNLNTKDEICNVFDMASNCSEWTTETNSNKSKPCIFRGGYYRDTSPGFNVANRATVIIDGSNDNISFRPILSLKTK